MKIKKLEMENFKSFYGKTTVEFADGLNVITGHNGSGKTSILDAIKIILTGKLPLCQNCISQMKTDGSVKVCFDEFEIFCKIAANSTFKFKYPDFLNKDNVANYFKNNSEFEIYDNNEFLQLNQNDYKKMADELKEKSKTKQIIIVSLNDYLISLADKIINIEKL